MASKWLALSGVALILLMVSAAGSPADARRGGHGGHGVSGARSFGGGQSGASAAVTRTPAPISVRPPISGTSYRLRSQAGSYSNLAQQKWASKVASKTKSGLPMVDTTSGSDKHGKHHRRHRRVLVGLPIIYGGYHYYYYGDCDWLRRRALATGSLYWWDRYYACTYEGY